MPARSEFDTPTTVDEFLTLLCGDVSVDARLGYIALLGFATRQPGSVEKVPAAWVEELRKRGFWFDGDMQDAAGVGERIREARFVALPG